MTKRSRNSIDPDIEAQRARLERLRGLLLAARQQVLRRVGEAEDQIVMLSESAQENHMVHVLTQLGERDRQALAVIGHALARIATGAFGMCVRCGEPIPDARLLVLPTTTTCVECAAADARRPVYEEAPIEELLTDG